ncbi:DUF881 domain-containing protein [Janibacter endophyticus]|uniref:DUF881 domain-containing protein n=1 Tax=Janibacter endophyticus TaxID=2806261 RepID=UPI0027DEA2AD|nr:DUF881 domain-containing protein [Janibacter endophyticus]
MGESSTRRDRLRSWFLDHRPSRWSAGVPVIALCAGLLFATSGTAAKGGDLRSEVTTLPGLIRERTHDNALKARQVEDLQATVSALTEERAPRTSEAERLSRDIAGLRHGTGFGEVSGPSVTVSLDDAPLDSDQIPEGFDVDDVVVHQQDVQGVVNALWRGGAEAMMIMDQRIISTSAVRCVGNTLILQGRVYSPPFVITAVGDPADLQAALDADPTVSVYKEYVAQLGLGYEVSSAESTTLPAYAGQSQLKHARAVR